MYQIDNTLCGGRDYVVTCFKAALPDSNSAFLLSSLVKGDEGAATLFKVVVPNLLRTKDWFHGKPFFFHRLGVGDWFQDD